MDYKFCLKSEFSIGLITGHNIVGVSIRVSQIRYEGKRMAHFILHVICIYLRQVNMLIIY